MKHLFKGEGTGYSLKLEGWYWYPRFLASFIFPRTRTKTGTRQKLHQRQDNHLSYLSTLYVGFSILYLYPILSKNQMHVCTHFLYFINTSEKEVLLLCSLLMTLTDLIFHLFLKKKKISVPITENNPYGHSYSHLCIDNWGELTF